MTLEMKKAEEKAGVIQCLTLKIMKQYNRREEREEIFWLKLFWYLLRKYDWNLPREGVASAWNEVSKSWLEARIPLSISGYLSA